MDAAGRTQEAARIMLDFARRTGLASTAPARRYLWTDAFALCEFLSLFEATGEARFRSLALELIDSVHETLGRHRPDDPRAGWISGLSEEEGRAHPTAGGLRIGKPLNERPAGARADARDEWDRDGQYFHYLAKWMHALMQAGRLLGRPEFLAWAVELAEAAHRGFVREAAPGAGLRMHWKMRIDLSAPLVPSMGQHDPLDGLVTCLALADAAGEDGARRLEGAMRDFSALLRQAPLDTDDPLGIGGLLFDAARLAQTRRPAGTAPGGLLQEVLAAAARGLAVFARRGDLNAPAERRLAFREFGVSIGLSVPPSLPRWLAAHRREASEGVRARLDDLRPFAPLRDAIESFWLAPASQRAATWTGHRDINAVMLATSLLPTRFLTLADAAAGRAAGA